MSQMLDITARVRKVVDRACRDELYALNLKVIAAEAGRAGVGTKEFRGLMEYFAESEEELRILTMPPAEANPTFTRTTLTTTTTGTITTAACTTMTTTTTTTTTSNLCIPQIQAPS